MTLLRQLVNQRRLTREELRARLQLRATRMGIARFAVELRQLDRWLSGTVKTLPHPTACRVLEAEFGHPVERLLAEAPPELPVPATDEQVQYELEALQLRLTQLTSVMQEEISLALSRYGGQPEPGREARPDGVRLAPVAARACQLAGISATGIRTVDSGTGAAFLLPEEPAVATVVAGPGATVRSRLSVILSEHLVAQGLPVVAPATIPSGRTAPIVLTGPEDVAVTFWHCSQRPERGAGNGPPELADLLRRLHELDLATQLPLPRYRPLVELEEAMAGVGDDAIGRGTRGLLETTVARMRDRYARMRWPLGDGLIHGDVAAGLRWNGVQMVLGDWYSACVGPREVDLVRVLTAGRLGLDAASGDQFASRYGWDPRRWRGYPLLRTIDELAALAPLVRRCATDRDAAAELGRRLTSVWETCRAHRW